MKEKFEYERRKPEKTVLYQTIRDYLDEFLIVARLNGKSLPQYVEDEFRAFLRCGCIQFGFVRRKCDRCGKEEFTPFSCKRRGFCPSCCGRRMAESAVHLMDNILPKKAMRQWVVTLPFPLRYLVSTNKEIQQKIHQLVIGEVHSYYTQKAKRLGVKMSRAGSITFIQRWGSALNSNLHFHILAVDGVWFLNGNDRISFKNISEPSQKDVSRVLERIRDRIFRFLRKKNILKSDPEYMELANDPLFEESPGFGSSKKASIIGRIAFGERAGKKVRFIGSGYGYAEEKAFFSGKQIASMNGFTLHCKTRIKAHDREGLERLVMYMARGPIATDRLKRADDDSGNLVYKLKRPFSDGRTHVLLSPIELLEKLSALIAPKWFNQIRYNGVFAPGSEWRGEIVKSLKKKREIDDESCEEERPSYRYSWSFLLKRVFNLDLDRCPECGGRLEFISSIQDSGVIKRILEHVGISTDPPDRPQRVSTTLDPLFDDLGA